MADRKISDLTALTAPASGDFLPIVDISEAAAVDKNKRVSIQNLFQGIPVSVGIGTSTPGTTLEVSAGGGSSPSLTGTGGNFAITQPGLLTSLEFGGYGSAPFGLWLQTKNKIGGSFPLILNPLGGAVGIGTGSPTSLLHLRTAGGNEVQIEPDSGTVASDTTAGLTLASTRAGGAPITFRNGGTEKVRIDSAGRVGIGTSAPASPLEVSSASNTQIRAVTTDATGASIAGLLLDQLGSGASTFIVRTGSNYSVLGTTTNTPVLFTVNNLERVRIDSSGRLLVGTSANTGGSLFQVNDNRIRVATAKTPASATDTGSTGEICWDANYIYVCTATNTWKRTAIATW